MMREDLKQLVAFEEAADEFRNAKKNRDKDRKAYEAAKTRMSKLRAAQREGRQPGDEGTASPETVQATARSNK